jgi:alkylation response protein AidB-like acyl-CoA dehydrogenase
MDLELSDEQTWLTDAIETLLSREWRPGADGASDRRALWRRLVDFGALTVGGEEGLGAVELCLVGRALGAHLAPVPYLASAAVRFAVAPLGAQAPRGFAALAAGGDAVALAMLEPGASWGSADLSTTIEGAPAGAVLEGRKAAVEHAHAADLLAVVAAAPDGPALALVSTAAPGITAHEQPAFDPTAPMHAVRFADVRLGDGTVTGGAVAAEALARLSAIGGLLAAAEAVGAAGRLLEDACRYAGERRQFGRPIGSFQALRHLLADMYVRQASSWSSVLFAAAALDEGLAEAARTASITKAYVGRASREVAHGAMQVFGGIAVTAEHPAHRYLRRIAVRDQQFGDAAHHERALGRALAATAAAAVPEPVS